MKRSKNIILLLIISVLSFTNIALARKERSHARYSACLSNQRVIMNAIEMYNMDHSTSIDRYDEETENLLIKEGYLKSNIQKPENQCIYKMSNDREIFCEYHGGKDPDKLKPCPEFAETLKNILQYKQNYIRNYIFQIIIVIAFWLWVIFFLKDLFSKSKKSSSQDSQIKANTSDSTQDSKDEVQNN